MDCCWDGFDPILQIALKCVKLLKQCPLLLLLHVEFLKGLTWVSWVHYHRIEINRKATRVRAFEVCVSTHVSLRMFIMQVLASQLPSLANRNAELAVPPLFWPVNCIKIGGHVALLSGATVYSLYCAITLSYIYVNAFLVVKLSRTETCLPMIQI